MFVRLALTRATFVCLISTLSTSLASPTDFDSNFNTLQSLEVKRANPTCTSPSQINLSQEPTMGSCNWKKWTACIAIAAGACLPACAAGGLLDPVCETCVAALGVIGCASCLDSAPAAQLEQSLFQQLAGMSSNIVKTVQAEYCQFSTPTWVNATLKQSGGTSKQTATA